MQKIPWHELPELYIDELLERNEGTVSDVRDKWNNMSENDQHFLLKTFHKRMRSIFQAMQNFVDHKLPQYE